LSSEMDDSYYREGQQMERQGRWDEALAAYLKVIDRRGDAAPESSLDVGLIYLNHIKDPVYAIYHFRKYLELEPNSKQAVYVRGLIDAAKREGGPAPATHSSSIDLGALPSPQSLADTPAPADSRSPISLAPVDPGD